MRRTYISPEFIDSKIYGSYNSFEESNFFGSKMLEIEDSINIGTQNIIYYQKLNNEQIDVDLETTQNSVTYVSFDSKSNNHILSLDISQTDSQLKSNTRWFLDIDLKTILTEFIFANLKKERTFQGLENQMVISKDVNVYIKEYIVNNVLDRYKLTNIDLYLSYIDITTTNNLQYQNIFDYRIVSDSNKLIRFQTETSFDYRSTRLTFNQEMSSDKQAFKYYFNLNFQKI